MGMPRDLKKALRRGRRDGYRTAYARGYAEGRKAGADSFAERFPGTSIIIPTYNKHKYLRECIDSIRAYTDVPYELLVVDNASRDGTAEYLRSQGRQLRYWTNERNIGFSGAVNQGLMMAKGETLLILNNDILVTPRWLSNLLASLQSSPNVGMVGPVTNFVSGDQLVEAPYGSLTDLAAFADAYNQSDAGRWVRTQRLVGFCLLMHRETFERVGYWDEGYQVGNYEDDDYGLRVMLSGLELVIAKDTFIHHYGNVTLKSFGAALPRLVEQNQTFFADKWGDRESLLALTRHEPSIARTAADFFPSHVAVCGPNGAVYWIEDGFRCPIEPVDGLAPVRLSQIDLLSLPVGPALTAESLRQRLADCAAPFDPEGGLNEGGLYGTSDGRVYQLKGRTLRRLATPLVRLAWRLHERAVHPLGAEQLDRYREGLPIIAPPVLHAANL